MDPAAGSVTPRGLLLGPLQVSVALLVHGLIVFSAGSISALLGLRPTRMRPQRCRMGIVLAGSAGELIFDRLWPVTVSGWAPP